MNQLRHITIEEFCKVAYESQPNRMFDRWSEVPGADKQLWYLYGQGFLEGVRRLGMSDSLPMKGPEPQHEDLNAVTEAIWQKAMAFRDHTMEYSPAWYDIRTLVRKYAEERTVPAVKKEADDKPAWGSAELLRPIG